MPECFHKSETHLQLCLQQVGVFPFVGIAIGVLRLQAAFGIEPPLHAGHIVALFVILRFVFVEIIIGCYNVEFGKYMYGCGCIVSVAFYMSVFAGKVFGTQADRLCLYGGACRPAVACVAVAYRYIWIDGRGGYSTAFALDERAAHRQPVERMNHQAAYYVFLIVLVFQINALPVHDGKVITQLFLEKVAVDKDTHVTAAVRAVEWIAAVDTCQIVDRL